MAVCYAHILVHSDEFEQFFLLFSSLHMLLYFCLFGRSCVGSFVSLLDSFIHSAVAFCECVRMSVCCYSISFLFFSFLSNTLEATHMNDIRQSIKKSRHSSFVPIPVLFHLEPVIKTALAARSLSYANGWMQLERMKKVEMITIKT